MKIRISTDSTADIPKSAVEEYGISVLPLSILSEDKEWLDGVTITPEEFYQVLEEADKLPSSAAVPPMLYKQLYYEAMEDGVTDLIHIALNSRGSSTFQNGELAREQFYEKNPDARDKIRIHLVDSLTYSMGYGMAVVHAAQMAREGAEPDAIIAEAKDWLANVLPTCVPLTLKCVKKSGRISAAAAFMGEAIGLKPIIRFLDGEAHIISKARGERGALREIISLIKSEIKPGSPYSLVLGNNAEANEKLAQAMREITGYEPEFAYQVGCIIAINTGPNMIGVIFRK